MKLCKHVSHLLWAYLCLAGVAPVCAETSLMTGIHYDACASDSAAAVSGDELTFPVKVAYKGEYFSFSVETAYSRAAVAVGDFTEAELASLTDTRLSVSYTYLFPAHPATLALTLDVNLPTGKARLNQKQTIAELGVNNDLFAVDDFGEGFNIGLSCGLTWDFAEELLAVQGTYLFKGKFDPTSEVADDDFAPGDQFLLFGLLEYRVTPWLNLSTSVSYAYFFPDKIQEAETFRQGNRFGIGGDVAIAHDAIEFSGSFQSIFSGRNVEIVENTVKDEASNSGINLFGLTEFRYHLSANVAVTFQGDIRYYSENDLKDTQTGLSYSGSRVRYAVGPGFAYFINDQLSCDGVVKFFTLRQDREQFLSDPANFQGLNVDLGLTYTF